MSKVDKTAEYISDYVDETLGFQVQIPIVRVTYYHGERIPEIDYKSLMKKAALHMLKVNQISGAMLMFIRKYMGLSLESMGKVLGVSKVTVKTWEEKKEDILALDSHMLINLKMEIKRFISKEMEEAIFGTSPHEETIEEAGHTAFEVDQLY